VEILGILPMSEDCGGGYIGGYQVMCWWLFCVGIFSIVFVPKVSADFCSADVTDFGANKVSSFDV